MFTNKAVAELAAWAEAVKNSDRATANQHLQQFRHLGGIPVCLERVSTAL